MQEVLAWVESVCGHRVTAMRALRGGLTSEVSALTLANGASLVLRRYTEWGTGAKPQIEQEASVLRRLEHTGVPAPRLVAFDARAAVPMILMTRVPGRIWLSPRDHDAWLRDMARTLAAIHQVPLEGGHPEPRMDQPEPIEIPGWTTRPRLWERARDALAQKPLAYPPTFTHGDYQHFNILWSRRRLSGVVDWCYAGAGHPDTDAAHCRLNLAILFSVDSAERFRELYEAEKGRPMDPWRDLRRVASYDQSWRQFIPVQVAGRARVDGEGMDARIEGLMERILRRL